MDYFGDYFDPSHFEGLALDLPAAGAAFSESDYFECDYFDPTYFDTPDCDGEAAVAEGHPPRGRRTRPVVLDEADEFLAVI